MDTKQRWRKRRHLEDSEILMLFPDWLASGFRKRSSKLRMRLLISMATCVFLIYLIFFSSQSSEPESSVAAQDINIKQRTSRSQWRISSKSRLKPVSVDTIIDYQAHAPQKVSSRLMGPSPEGVKLAGRHAPPGYMGVGGEMDLKPPPGPSLQLDKPPGPYDHMNPRMRIVDSVGLGKSSGKVGPPGQSNAMHLVEGEAYPNLGSAIGVIQPPNIDAVLSKPTERGVPLGKTLPKIVYLDLRVGPPKLSYLEQIIPLLGMWGATGLLIDYEENFPYNGELSPIASTSAYSKADVKRLVRLARLQNLEVIPLVQVFSNTEFILKHAEFQHLQERTGFMQNLNPAKNASKGLLAEMINQVLELHPGTKNVHLGCEEIYYMGFSRETKVLMESTHKKSSGIFLQHVKSMATYVKSRHVGVGIIIWDNVLRSIPENILKKSGVGGLIEPMVIMNTFDVSVPSEVITKFANIFSRVWITTIFNHPITNIATVPSPLKYIKDQQSWLEKINVLSKTIKIQGIVWFGSYKTTHFAPIGAVLLPMALPTLGMCLKTFVSGTFNISVLHDVINILQCAQDKPYSEDHPLAGISKCHFPGSALFSDFVDIQNNVIKMRRVIDSKGQNDISPIVRKFEDLLPRLPSHLAAIFNIQVAREWIESHVLNNLTPLGGFKTKAKTLISQSKWLARSPMKGLVQS